jgi:NAD(P)-dependent dehydrogenase (short-subunit alcohol dehydrogenase family)
MTRNSAIDIAGKRLLVTGAARGIGRAVAIRAAQAGARVFAVDLRADELKTLADEESGVIATRTVDLSAVSTLDALCEEAAETLGQLDALIHVAGVIVRRPDLDSVTEEDWDLQCDVNLKATFFLDRAAARVMQRQGTPGAIVNFSSQGWWTGGFGGSVAYSATKGGVVSLTRGLARSLAPSGIRVNCVAPGAVDTAMMREGLDEDAKAKFLQQVPMARMGEPDELADAALFLVSEASTYITGATLNVSGGQLMY